jgi:hypothetical protein
MLSCTDVAAICLSLQNLKQYESKTMLPYAGVALICFVTSESKTKRVASHVIVVSGGSQRLLLNIAAGDMYCIRSGSSIQKVIIFMQDMVETVHTFNLQQMPYPTGTFVLYAIQRCVHN